MFPHLRHWQQGSGSKLAPNTFHNPLLSLVQLVLALAEDEQSHTNRPPSASSPADTPQDYYHMNIYDNDINYAIEKKHNPSHV